MPMTKIGKKVFRQMKKKYGKKAKNVYFGSIVKGRKGSEKWEGKGGSGKLAKAKRTYAKRHKGNKKSKR